MISIGSSLSSNDYSVVVKSLDFSPVFVRYRGYISQYIEEHPVICLSGIRYKRIFLCASFLNSLISKFFLLLIRSFHLSFLLCAKVYIDCGSYKSLNFKRALCNGSCVCYVSQYLIWKRFSLFMSDEMQNQLVLKIIVSWVH